MIVLNLLLHLVGAIMLLLYAVRMVRTGIERALGASFMRIATQDRNLAGSALAGLVFAVVLQSSAAVALLIAGFAGAGAIPFGTGLAAVLGADLGSALIVRVLSFDLEWLVPVLLALGGGFFIKTTGRTLRQAGRILLGIAFIIISLRFMRETMEPLRSSEFLPAIAGFLEQDALSAFLVGAALTWFMHSSVAAILMCATLVSVGALPLGAAVSLVLGANLGSSLIAITLTRGMSAQARRIPLANGLVRGTWALLALILCRYLPITDPMARFGDVFALMGLHILFNFSLLIVLPFVGKLEAPLTHLLPDAPQLEPGFNPLLRSSLDQDALSSPKLALASLRREVMRMSELVGSLFEPVMDLFETYDSARAEHLADSDSLVNTALDDIRHYVAAMPVDAKDKTHKQARDLNEYAIALESAGDLVVKRLLPLAHEKSVERLRFSAAGRAELEHIYDKIRANMRLALNVLMSDDLESARLLLEEKYEMTQLERASRKKHLKRLRAGEQVSFDSSDIHLETLRTFKEFNSLMASVAYPILYRSGQLLETRLITSLDKEMKRANG